MSVVSDRARLAAKIETLVATLQDARKGNVPNGRSSHRVVDEPIEDHSRVAVCDLGFTITMIHVVASLGIRSKILVV